MLPLLAASSDNEHSGRNRWVDYGQVSYQLAFTSVIQTYYADVC